MTDSASPRFIDQLASLVHRNLLWLLLACYVISAFFPQAGVAIRSWQRVDPFWDEVSLSLPLVLLALMLFCAALSTKLSNVVEVANRPWALIWGLLFVWLGPILYVSANSLLFQKQLPDGVLVGLALVATMPVANSSVGWSQNSNGNLALSLALILFSIALCPWVTPNLLQIVGLSFTSTERAFCDLLVNRFSGKFFIVWVILPTLLGFIARYLVGPERVARVASGTVLVSAMCLLLLNYANAALALPEVLQNRNLTSFGATVPLAIGLSALGMLLAGLLLGLLKESPGTRPSLYYGLSMKHTGLALVLAGTVLEEQPNAILMIIIATLVQHLMAGVVQWYWGTLESARNSD